ncbi:hypothetical protein HYC85_030024 [Camellia sinensis]|uniref:Uncharacterized protein n=1 Tax=Camellia sinensis TaxID=4442 RepID=A0A7J7FZI9_CAMSI|nr:hypothetical protein HYC85_030024 [Camellia sinensis]
MKWVVVIGCSYQKSIELLIRKLPFKRLVREIAQDFKREPILFLPVSLISTSVNEPLWSNSSEFLFYINLANFDFYYITTTTISSDLVATRENKKNNDKENE